MAPITSSSTTAAEELDIIQNRLAIAFAERERLIKSWTASSLRPRPPPKTQEQLDAEDAELFHLEPPHLGLGATIPKEFLEGDLKRKEISSNQKLLHLMLGKRSGLQASKPRDSQEKAGSAKRGLLKVDSSDEEEGRSALGRAKKIKQEPSKSISVQGISSKDEMKNEPTSPVVSTSAKAINTENFVRVDSKPLLKKIEIQGPAAKHTVQNLKKEPVFKKPLVDYASDEEEDKPIAGKIASEDSSLTKAASTTSKTLNEETKSNIVQNTSDTTTTLKESVSRATAVKRSTSSVSSSKQSSTASLSDSEPSDLETVIPMALASDIVPRQSISSPGTPRSPEQRREKNRLKRAKKRDKKLRERERELALANAKASMVSMSSGVKVKLKDRLLDANGN